MSEARRIYTELKLKVGYTGAVDHKKVGIPDLFAILAAAKSPSQFKAGLQAMNLFYNFGIRLKHREIASRILAAAMVCKVESEAVELIKLGGTWLEKPPDIALVYGVMSHHLDAGEHHVVREIAQAVREDWRMPVEGPLYAIAMEAMLRLPENAVLEAGRLHEDARTMGVLLPAALHARLLDASLTAFETALASQESAEASEAGLSHLAVAVQAASGLRRDGHLLGGASAAPLCSVAWLLWHAGRLTETGRARFAETAGHADVMSFAGGDWSGAVAMAMENFSSRWGFSSKLPRGFFQSLENSEDAKAAEVVSLARRRFGRFYPKDAGS